MEVEMHPKTRITLVASVLIAVVVFVATVVYVVPIVKVIDKAIVVMTTPDMEESPLVFHHGLYRAEEEEDPTLGLMTFLVALVVIGILDHLAPRISRFRRLFMDLFFVEDPREMP